VHLIVVEFGYGVADLGIDVELGFVDLILVHLVTRRVLVWTMLVL